MHGTGLSAGLVSGQLSLELECAMLHEPGSYPAGSKVDVLVATPGRLTEHLDGLVHSHVHKYSVLTKVDDCTTKRKKLINILKKLILIIIFTVLNWRDRYHQIALDFDKLCIFSLTG